MAGHTLRGNEKWCKSNIFWYPRNDKIKRGKQHRRWQDEIKAIARKEWTSTALNEGRSWRRPLPNGRSCPCRCFNILF